jgi:competence protein ComGC
MNKRKNLVIILILLVILVVSIVMFLFLRQNESDTQRAPERGGVPIISFEDPNNVLYDSISYKDYQAIRERLTEYVVSQKGDPWTTIKVSNVKTPYREGTIVSFSATIDSLNQADLKVEFDYAAKPYPTFSIKEKNFIVPLYGGQD